MNTLNKPGVCSSTKYTRTSLDKEICGYLTMLGIEINRKKYPTSSLIAVQRSRYIDTPFPLEPRRSSPACIAIFGKFPPKGEADATRMNASGVNNGPAEPLSTAASIVISPSAIQRITHFPQISLQQSTRWCGRRILGCRPRSHNS